MRTWVGGTADEDTVHKVGVTVYYWASCKLSSKEWRLQRPSVLKQRRTTLSNTKPRKRRRTTLHQRKNRAVAATPLRDAGSLSWLGSHTVASTVAAFGAYWHSPHLGPQVNAGFCCQLKPVSSGARVPDVS